MSQKKVKFEDEIFIENHGKYSDDDNASFNAQATEKNKRKKRLQNKSKHSKANRVGESKKTNGLIDPKNLTSADRVGVNTLVKELVGIERYIKYLGKDSKSKYILTKKDCMKIANDIDTALSKQEELIIQAIYVHGFSINETAEHFGISNTKIKSQLLNIIDKLKDAESIKKIK